jgi:hypothetical protein
MGQTNDIATALLQSISQLLLLPIKGLPPQIPLLLLLLLQ